MNTNPEDVEEIQGRYTERMQTFHLPSGRRVKFSHVDSDLLAEIQKMTVADRILIMLISDEEIEGYAKARLRQNSEDVLKLLGKKWVDRECGELVHFHEFYNEFAFNLRLTKRQLMRQLRHHKLNQFQLSCIENHFKDELKPAIQP